MGEIRGILGRMRCLLKQTVFLALLLVFSFSAPARLHAQTGNGGVDPQELQNMLSALNNIIALGSQGAGTNAAGIAQALEGVNLSNMTTLLSGLNGVGNINGIAGQIDINMLGNVSTAFGNGGLANTLQDAFDALNNQYTNGNLSPEQQQQVYQQMQQLQSAIQNYGSMQGITNFAQNGVQQLLDQAGLGNFASSMQQLMGGNFSDPQALANALSNIDMDKLNNVMSQLGIAGPDALAKFLPAGVDPSKLQDMFDKFSNGGIDGLMEDLKKKIQDKINAGIGDIAGLQSALDKLKEWGKKLEKVGKFLDNLLTGGFIGGLFEGPPEPPLKKLGEMLSSLGTVAVALKEMSVARDRAEEIGGLLDTIKIDDALKEGQLLPKLKKENLFEYFPNVNASEIAALKRKMKDGSLMAALPIVRMELVLKRMQTINPVKKVNLQKQITKIDKLMFVLPFVHMAVNRVSSVVKGYLEEGGLGDMIGGLGELIDAYKGGTLASGAIDIEALAAKLGTGDMTQLIERIRKVGNPALEDLASYLPDNLKLEDLQKVMDGFDKGILNSAMNQLKGKLGDLIQNALPGNLPNLTQLQDSIGKLSDSLKGQLGDAANGILAGSGLGDLLGGLGKGGFTGAASNIPLDQLGLDNVNIPGVGNLGDLLGQAASSGSGTLGDVLNSGAIEGLGSVIGNLVNGGIGGINTAICKRYNHDAQRSGSGNTQMIDGKGDHDEVPDCPSVKCSEDDELKKRIKGYLNYNPPSSNLKTLQKTSLHDYEVDFGRRYALDSTQRFAGYDMNIPDCKNITDNDLSEPCQDNRWRDACMTGVAQKDEDFNLYSRALGKNEEPWPGVSGSRPFVDPSDTSKINCMVPKTTENISPLTLDNGWRFRYMCPGDNQLSRNPMDGLSQRNDLFYGGTKCFAPLPKCQLKKDWDIDSTSWRDTAHGIYEKANSGKGSLVELFGRLTPDQQNAVKELFNSTSSRAPECKPAFWVRLMADSCANQFIGLNAAQPDLTYNPDQQLMTGLSARFCQPLKTDITTNFEEEYDPTEYLKNAATSVLSRDYLPWLDRGNPWKGDEADDLYDEWKKKMDKDAERKIQAPGQYDESQLADIYKDKHKIVDYTQQPVERVLDPTHPYSPRYDIAMFSEGDLIDDRNLFDGATETKMWPNPMLMISQDAAGDKLKCQQWKKKGYFEYDKGDISTPFAKGCPVYCSAVKVDVMRFRYEDYRLCMGCQIDANQNAFWDEQKKNRNYYFGKRCWTQFDSSDEMPEEPEDDECIYGDDVCGSCTNAVINCAVCAVSGAKCDECGEDVVHCVECGFFAGWEATTRARLRINHKEEPEYGPTKTKSDDKNWPVCSTRYDYEGDEELCKKAKEEVDNCSAQGEAGQDDPNIGEDKTSEAKNCVDKKIADICHDAAKPVYGLNFLKIRPTKKAFKTEELLLQAQLMITAGKNDQDPPKPYQFRTYFKSNRPYMRWWDTGKEAFQGKDAARPDYSCDVGANDTFVGVGRDSNSIHSRKQKICSYMGGDGIGDDNCYKMKEWRDGDFPELAGTEWAELKMYQMNCFRAGGLNCLCQYEKIFKQQTSEDAVLAALGGTIQTMGVGETACYGESAEPCHDKVPSQYRDEHNCPQVIHDNTDKKSPNYMKFKNMTADGKFAVVEVKKPCEHSIPLGWRGYASAPENAEQFPYLYGNSNGSIISGGLDQAQKGDVIIWPSGKGTLPRIALVDMADNAAAYPGGDIKKSPKWIQNNKFEGSVIITEKNNGILPDVCGNTSELNKGGLRTLYKNKDSMPTDIVTRMHEQVSATYYCENPYLGNCIEKMWNDVVIFRPTKAAVRN